MSEVLSVFSYPFLPPELPELLHGPFCLVFRNPSLLQQSLYHQNWLILGRPSPLANPSDCSKWEKGCKPGLICPISSTGHYHKIYTYLVLYFYVVHFLPSLPPHSAPVSTEIIWSRSTNSPPHLVLEHWWLLLWEHNFTDHFHCICSIQARKLKSWSATSRCHLTSEHSSIAWSLLWDLAINISCQKCTSKLSAQPGCMEHRPKECCICYHSRLQLQKLQRLAVSLQQGVPVQAKAQLKAQALQQMALLLCHLAFSSGQIPLAFSPHSAGRSSWSSLWCLFVEWARTHFQMKAKLAWAEGIHCLANHKSCKSVIRDGFVANKSKENEWIPQDTN